MGADILPVSPAATSRYGGKHFDPRVVDVFFECLEEILAIQQKYKDEGGKDAFAP